MENFIIGLFSQQLSTYIHGFRKEQVNANLLNGKGEIIDIYINVDPVNDIVRQMNPYFEFKSIFISKLSFHITSLRQIQKAPVEIYLDEVHMEVQEALEYHGYTKEQWADKMKNIIEKALKSSSYGISERIQDNVTFEVNRIYVSVQTMGRLKTRKIGSWTPPSISFILNEVRFVSVDIFGEEGPPQAVWDHNSRAAKEEAKVRAESGNGSTMVNDRSYRKGTVMIYKKLFAKVSVGIGYRIQGMSVKQACLSSHLMIVDQSAQAHLCIHRRKNDCAILAVQIDTSFQTIEIDVDVKLLTLLSHFASGVEYLLMKNRSFSDPFHDDTIVSTTKSPHVEFEDGDIPDDVESESSSDDDNDDWATEIKRDARVSSSSSPILVLQGGAIVWEKISFSFTLHHFSIRLRYKNDTREYLHLKSNGIYAQVIYPSSSDAAIRGCCLQFTCARIDVEDIKFKRIEKLLSCGPPPDTQLGDNFPRFEKTMIRENFFDRGVIFPIQALGLKMVFYHEDINPSSNKVIVSQLELGINHSEVSIWIDEIAKGLSDVKNLEQCFDANLHSTIWLKEATGLLDNIDEFLQMIPEIENKMVLNVVDILSNSSIRLRRCKINVHNTADVIHIFTATLSVDEFSFLSTPTLPQHLFMEDNADKSSFNQNEASELPLVGRSQVSVSDFFISFETEMMDRRTILDVPVISISFSLEGIQNTSMIVSTKIQDLVFHVDIPLVLHALKAHLAVCEVMKQFKVINHTSFEKAVENVIIRSYISHIHGDIDVPLSSKKVLIELDMNTYKGLLHLSTVPSLRTILLQYSIKDLVLKDLESHFDSDQSRNMFQFHSMCDDGDPIIACKIEKDKLHPNFVVSFQLSSGTLELRNDIKTLISLIAHFQGRYLRKTRDSDVVKIPVFDDRMNYLSKIFMVDINEILFAHVELQIKDLAIAVPYGGDSKALSLVIGHLQFLTGFFAEELTEYSTFQPRWTSIFRDAAPGFHHIFTCAQRCLLSSFESVVKRSFETAEPVMGKFEIDSYIHPSNEYSFADEFRKWKELYSLISAHEVVSDSVQSFQNASSNVTSLQNAPLIVLIKEVEAIIGTMTKSLDDTKTALRNLSDYSNTEFTHFKALQMELIERAFESENHRLGICSTLSHRMSGFLNMSRSASSGERIVSVNTFWKYWVVVTEDLLVLFNSTNHSKPTYTISLRQSQILAFTGSGNKHRYSKAFVIRNSQSKEFFFVAPTYAEYEKWITILNAITHEMSGSTTKVNVTISGKSKVIESIDEPEPSTLDVTLSSSQDSFSELSDSNIRASGGNLDIIAINKSTARNVSKFREKMSSSMTSGVSKFKTRMATVKERSINSRKSDRVEAMETGESKGFKLRNIKVIEEQSSIKETLSSDQNQDFCAFDKIWCAYITVRCARDLVESENMNVGLIFVINVKSLSDSTEQDTTKTLIEIMDFHSKISYLLTKAHDSVTHMDQSEGVKKVVLHDLIAIGKTLGHVLTRLDLQDRCDSSMLKYIGDTISSLIDLLLSRPIPRSVAEYVAEFLSLSYQYINPKGHEYNPSGLSSLNSFFRQESEKTPFTREIFSSLDMVQNNLKVTENKLSRIGELQNKISARTSLSAFQNHADERISHSSNTYFRDIFDRLMKQRDEAHSKLISSQVLHNYELERERNRMEILELKASYFETMYYRDSAPANLFFLGQETLPDAFVTRLDDLENQVLQHLNGEFLSIREHMAAELKSLMDTELEISRLQETLVVERSIHDTEYQKVLAELNLLKARVETIEKEKASLENEKEQWKAAFEMTLFDRNHSSSN